MAVSCCHNGSLNFCLMVLPVQLAGGRDECKSMMDEKRGKAHWERRQREKIVLCSSAFLEEITSF